MKAQRPDVFSYNDYTLLLKDWVVYLKATQSKFSLRFLARQAGLASGYLPMILKGDRPLSAAALAKLLPHLNMSSTEQSYLDCLLVLKNSDSHDSRMSALDRMKRFSQFRHKNAEETAAYQYLTHWYYIAIREMAGIEGFRDDPEWVQEHLQFQVPLKETKEALKFLFKNKFLEKTSDGSVRAPTEILNCQGDIYSVGLAHFHREILRLAGQSIDKIRSDERNIMGHTCALSEENFLQARLIAQEAIEKIRALGTDNNGKTVYHLEVALFPLTVKREKVS